MNITSLLLTVIMLLLVIFVPRKWSILPYIAVACLIPMDQRFIIAGLDFTALRFCVLAGFIRVWIRGELCPIQWNIMDKIILTWMLGGSVIYVIQWQSFAALVNRSGVLFDGIGLYWIFRLFFRDWSDIVTAIKCFAFLAIVSGPLILVEKITQSSPFSIFGHSPASVHRGRFRCSGPFPHYIMMGLFWANLLPLFYSCIKAGISKMIFWIAFAASLLSAILSASSTPLLTIVVVAAFSVIYKYRFFGRQITFSIVILLACLQIVMNNPIWHLMARVNIFEGSTGWHRYFLVDQFIVHISDWFLLGVQNTEDWGMGLSDITNQYVLEGVRGGAITLCIFIFLNIIAVRIPAKASILFTLPAKSWLCWGVCVSVLGHSISFWGVSYFGQIMIQLYLLFAVIAFIQEQIDTGILKARG